MRETVLTLGSLFDGIGGFPLAGLFSGITPVWASEIEAFPISVTKIRFPEMEHVGDITKLNGAKLPLVDIVTGGSPCQDLSVAGARGGLKSERSGLFMEQIRIIKEMRWADEQSGRTAHAVRPRYMVWENVPGAFSSGDPCGEDFRVVLEETAGIVDSGISIPGSPGGVWKPAGAILGYQFSIAWRVLDTQYWPGTPQRRRRIFLVADFGGHSAPKILFEQDSLFGDTAQGKDAGQGSAAAAQASAGDTSGTDGCLTPWDAQSKRIHDSSGVWPSLYSAGSGGRGYVSEEKETEPIGFDGYNGDLTGDKSATLGVNCGMSTGRNGVVDAEKLTVFACNQRDEVRDLNDIAGALQAQPGMKQQTFVAMPAGKNNNCLTPWDTQQSRVFTPDGIAPNLCGADGGGGRNPAGLMFSAGVITKGNGEVILTPEKHTSLTSGGGQAGQGYPCVLTAGFCAGAAPTAGGIGYQEECAPTLKGSSGGNMVPSVICLNDQGGQRMDVYEDITGTLRAQMDGHPPLVLTERQGYERNPTICINDQGGTRMEIHEEKTGALCSQTKGHLPLVMPPQPQLYENHGLCD